MNRITQIVFILSVLFQSSFTFAGSAEDKFLDEIIHCASYYKISSDALTAMSAPQMKGIADKLKLSHQKSLELALKYDQSAASKVAVIEKKQILEMKASSGLRELMTQYRNKCQQILAAPDERLKYWQMVEM